MDKSTRWTIYTAIIVAFVASGLWLTYTQSPDQYTHQEAPDPSVLPSDDDDGEFSDDGLSPEPTAEFEERGDAAKADDEAEALWLISITGVVHQVNVLDAGEEDEFVALQLSYDDSVSEGGAPNIASPVVAVGRRHLVESQLGRMPRKEDLVTIESDGIDREMQSLAIKTIELADE